MRPFVVITCTAMLAACASKPPPTPFQLAKRAEAVKDYPEAARQFLVVARQELAWIRGGGSWDTARNTSLLYRDAANHFLLAKDGRNALAALRECVSELAFYAEGDVCDRRGMAMVSESSEFNAEHLMAFRSEVTPYRTVREQRKAAVQAQVASQKAEATARAERNRIAWEAGAAERERQRREEEEEKRQADRQMLEAYTAMLSAQNRNQRTPQSGTARPSTPPPATYAQSTPPPATPRYSAPQIVTPERPSASQTPNTAAGTSSSGHTQRTNLPGHRACISVEWGLFVREHDLRHFKLKNTCAMPLTAHWCEGETCTRANQAARIGSGQLLSNAMMFVTKKQGYNVRILQACSLKSGNSDIWYDSSTNQCVANIRMD